MKKIKINQNKGWKIKIHRDARRTIIAVLALLIIFSSYTAFSAYQQPTTKEKLVPTYAYTHTGIFDYTIHIKNNSLFASKILKPGQGTIFKKLVDHINISFTYEFMSTRVSQVSGSYEITAEVQTNYWTKEFPIIRSKKFEGNTTQTTNSETFPLNVTTYEKYIETINEQTGVAATETMLTIKCTVFLSATSNEDEVNEIFTHSIQIPLGNNVITLEGELSKTQNGQKETTEEEYLPGVTSQRSNWTASSAVFIVLLIGVVLLTKSDMESLKSPSRHLKKIKRKYGEWIVDVDTPPSRSIGAEKVETSSFDDLLKISEELGKPIIHHENKEKNHTFYVLEETVHYTYTINEK
jgi:hypothetical protein